MAKLVLGTDKNNTGTSSVIKEKPVPMPYSIQYNVDSNGKITKSNEIMDFTGVKDIGDYAFYYSYYNNYNITQVDMSDIERITGNQPCNYMFYKCTALESVDLSNLKVIRSDTYQPVCGYMFANCTSLTSIDLSNFECAGSYSACESMFSNCTSLTSVNLGNLVTSDQWSCRSMFQGCTALESVNLSKLTGFTSQYSCNNMFYNCKKLKSIDLPSLISMNINGVCTYMFYYCSSLENINLDHVTFITGQNACSNMFAYCTSLTELSFPSLFSLGTRTDQFDNMLYGCSNVTVHFPSNLELVIGNWSSVLNGFNGTNTTILFDLPATDGNLDFSFLTEYGCTSESDYRGSPLYSTFQDNSDIISINFSGLETIYSTLTISTNSNLKSIDFSNLKEMKSGLTIINNASLTNINFSNLKCKNGYISLRINPSLANVNFDSLEEINVGCQYMLDGCTSLTELRFPSLKTVADNQVFNEMLRDVTGCTVHFPSNLSSYNFNCGGNNTTILYDLPPTA